MDNIILKLEKTLNISKEKIEVVLNLLNDGATVPFIARYRKEQTGALDENQIREIEKEWDYQNNLAKRKEDVKRLIDEKGMLTDALANAIDLASKLVDVEDLYLPYKEKKKTKGSVAKSLGMEPLAKYIMSCPICDDTNSQVSAYLNDKVTSVDEALSYAKDIIREEISENANYRKILRNNIKRVSSITTKKKKTYTLENSVYENYFDYTESTKTIKDHRILAINRAEKEEAINVSIEADDEANILYLTHNVIFKETSFKDLLNEASKEAYMKLIFPSLEREIRASLTERAEKSAINVFGLNLKNLLLQAPLKDKMVLGVDPAFRTGCKLAVVDQTGKMLEIAVIKPTEEYPGSGVKERDMLESKKIFSSLCNKYNIDIVSIGNGTASRETEAFVSETIKEYNLKCKYVIVSEAGASVYSASEIAQEEFPDLTLEKRSAVSIARRIQDPLAELIKIDPKSIGVGQYQHDVNQRELDNKLGEVVLDAVNAVGADLNTASESLLTYISGFNKTIAKNVVKYRNEHGKFKNRSELLNVPRLGEKAYVQAAGFLRVYDTENKLDETSIHPESYEIANKILKKYNLSYSDIGNKEKTAELKSLNKESLAKELDSDIYTIEDIISSFEKPRRDIRDEYKTPILKQSVTHLEDLKIGDELEGTVRNVVDFGAFVDVGLHDDGLVHISKISKNYIKHPSEVLSVGDIVKVYVIGIDLVKHKLQLSMI